MDIKQPYIIEEINCYHDIHKLSVGFIVECRANADYGIIYQYNDDKHSSECSKGGIYYFHKDLSLEIVSKTMVTFLKDFSRSWKRNFEVENVSKITEYETYVSISKEEKETSCYSSTTKKIEDMMKNGKKFIAINYDEEKQYLVSKIYFPILDIQTKTICYYFRIQCFCKQPKDIFECYAYNIVNKNFFHFNVINEKINEVLRYVKSLKLDDILKHFNVYGEGYYHSRPGGDDYYTYSKNRICSASDPYLTQLTELGTELIDYSNCQGRENEDYSTLDLDETAFLREEVKQKYNKSEHIIFLIKVLLERITNTKINVNEASMKLHKFIKKGDEHILNKNYTTLSQWKDFISSFNLFF